MSGNGLIEAIRLNVPWPSPQRRVRFRRRHRRQASTGWCVSGVAVYKRYDEGIGEDVDVPQREKSISDDTSTEEGVSAKKESQRRREWKGTPTARL